MSNRATGLDRRDFLRLSAIAAAIPLAGPLSASSRVVALGSPLRPGFLAGSEALLDLGAAACNLCHMPTSVAAGAALLAELDQLIVVPADAIPLGDQELANGIVELIVHGLYPGLPTLDVQGMLRAELTALFPSEDGTTHHPFTPWAVALGDGPSPSPPIRFRMPVGPLGELDLALAITSLPPRVISEFGLDPKNLVAAGTFRTRFTVDWEPGAPRLQRGLYLLPLSQKAWSRTTRLTEPGRPAPMSLCSIVMGVEPIAEH